MSSFAYEFQLIFSVALIVAVLLLRAASARVLLRYNRVSADVRRRWLVGLRNASIVLVGFGLFLIWADELRTLAVSLIAFAVAGVIATKEIILCASGALVRATGDSYSIGDRIEIGGIRGEVIDQSMLTTTLLEMGPPPIHQFTGRTVVLPNSLLLSTPVYNEAYHPQVDLHIIRVPLGAGDDWEVSERLLLEAAHAECGGFLAEAKDHLRQVETLRGLDAPSVEPRVTVHVNEPGQVVLLLRVASPARQKDRVEQAILRRYLAGTRHGSWRNQESVPHAPGRTPNA